ncbi:MAG: PKD domain-containing protein [Candidatus Bathyarchaeota archaeon]|nr:PKD domain-containing protein [Candidatus Bathyarchaeota archaeon]
MKRKALLTALLVVCILISVSILPLAISAQADVDAGPDQTAYVGQEVTFTGSVFPDNASIVSITWDFGDGSDPVNGSDPSLLNITTHIYQTAAVYNVTLTVKLNSVYNLTETDTVTITVVQNEPPVADAGPDQIVEATSPAGAEVVLNASGSSDPNDDLLTYDWTWTSGSATGVNATAVFPLGTTNVTLTVNDGQYNSTDTVSITVADTTPPIVDAGEDMTVEQESYNGTEVTLSGNATDLADIELDYVWTENGVILGSEANLTYTFNLGTHELTLTATDDSGNSGNDTIVVTVVDTTPPELTVLVNPEDLWPPNHKYVEVTTVVTAHDVCDPSPKITFISITSNEPDNARGIGDGNTIDDIVIVDDFTFELRAERGGNGSGRIYTITYQATDASGNSAQASATVTVKHNS